VLLISLLPTLSHATELRGTGDLGVVVERAKGSVLIIETTTHTRLAEITDLGDLSHASVVYSRDQHFWARWRPQQTGYVARQTS